MARVVEGRLDGTGKKFGVVLSRFNDMIGRRLLDGALDCLVRHGVAEEDVRVVRVPGSFEIPLVAARMAATKSYDAVICLGAVIRGETPHFDYVAGEVAKGINRIALDTGVPVLFGIVTADTLDQALERAGAKQGNRGWDAGLSALEMAALMKEDLG
ncbi:MAG: 6,7-dimethyl-8-ribityllumazine synthase [Candidatus Eisenbacteria bacterium]|nr:6,7-dimethyl-8-ribityllumazine synthase [Candidatus Eisenbacteria bacterium]